MKNFSLMLKNNSHIRDEFKYVLFGGDAYHYVRGKLVAESPELLEPEVLAANFMSYKYVTKHGEKLYKICIQTFPTGSLYDFTIAPPLYTNHFDMVGFYLRDAVIFIKQITPQKRNLVTRQLRSYMVEYLIQQLDRTYPDTSFRFGICKWY